MRTFILIDNDGNTYDVTSKDSAFFYGITGLGYEKETEFQRIKERFALLKKDLKQTVISGTVRFWQKNAEQKYFEFAQFCQNSPLRIAYNPKAGVTQSTEYSTAYAEGTTVYLPSTWLSPVNYYRDGYITKIEKADGVGDCLTVNIEFTALTPWYKTVTEYNYGNVITGGKKYNYKYSYVYKGGVANTVEIESDSRLPSPIKLVIIGAATNPTWRHYLNRELVTEGKVNGVILPDHRLVIDTTTIPYSIKEYDALGNFVADLYQASDFSTDRFVRLGYGTNLITVTAEDVNILGIGVEAQIEYASV